MAASGEAARITDGRKLPQGGVWGPSFQRVLSGKAGEAGRGGRCGSSVGRHAVSTANVGGSRRALSRRAGVPSRRPMCGPEYSVRGAGGPCRAGAARAHGVPTRLSGGRGRRCGSSRGPTCCPTAPCSRPSAATRPPGAARRPRKARGSIASSEACGRESGGSGPAGVQERRAHQTLLPRREAAAPPAKEGERENRPLGSLRKGIKGVGPGGRVGGCVE